MPVQVCADTPPQPPLIDELAGLLTGMDGCLDLLEDFIRGDVDMAEVIKPFHDNRQLIDEVMALEERRVEMLTRVKRVIVLRDAEFRQ